MTPRDTIYALSSGPPPAAIAIVRISGQAALGAVSQLAGVAPVPRRASLAALSHGGELLDRAVVLCFEGPNTATGEDVAELHLHGGRAVVSAVLAALATLPGLRAAEPGEFTRRAFENGRIDLLEAEGLADLLTAETETQRRAAVRMAGGHLSRLTETLTARLLRIAAGVEALLDFADEGDVTGTSFAWADELDVLRRDIAALLAKPPAERLRDGVRVVLAGPPNAGKSTLLNALVGRDAAITSAIAGTTRDLIEVPMVLAGLPFLFIDSAGLRAGGDEVEAIGITRAQAAIGTADILVWLGESSDAPARDHILIAPKADLPAQATHPGLAVSAITGKGLPELIALLRSRARELLPAESEMALNARQRVALAAAHDHLCQAAMTKDLLLAAEELRQARLALDRLAGRAGVDAMLDELFGRFCIGK